MPEHLSKRDLDGVDTRTPDPATPPAEGEPLARAWQRVQSDRDALNDREQEILRRALTEAGGVVAHAARELGLARTTLASRLDALGIRAGKREA